MIERPARSEYEAYYHRYVCQVPDADVLELMAANAKETLKLLGAVGEDGAGYRYAPDKWSIKQVVGHVTDIERLFGYRALAFARLDPSHLPSIEQDDYVKHANFDERPLADILEEFDCVRMSFLALFRGFNDEILLRKGTASGFEFTVRSMPFIMAGHEIHHVKVLRERYL